MVTVFYQRFILCGTVEVFYVWSFKRVCCSFGQIVLDFGPEWVALEEWAEDGNWSEFRARADGRAREGVERLLEIIVEGGDEVGVELGRLGGAFVNKGKCFWCRC